MYKYIHTCIYIHIYMSAHIHTYTYMHTHIQNVRMKRTQARLERRRGSERARSCCRQGSFALLFRSTQSTNISKLKLHKVTYRGIYAHVRALTGVYVPSQTHLYVCGCHGTWAPACVCVCACMYLCALLSAFTSCASPPDWGC